MSTDRGGQPTIHDVADRAGVSKSAVSRVLSGSGRFSEETRVRVEAAAAELGYVVNGMARSLARGRTATIGVLIRDATSMVYAAFHAAMDVRAAELGYRVVTTTGVNRVEHEKPALSGLVELRVDGLIVCSGLLPAADIAEFAPRIATVVAGRPEQHPLISSVFCDETGGGTALAETVADAGHRTVAVLTVPRTDALTQHERTAAMVSRLRASGVEVVPLDARFARGAEELADELIGAKSERGITAAMFPTDRMLVDVCSALDRRGIRVPDDLSVTGFDGVAPLDAEWIGLTTLRQPAERIGRDAVDLVVERIADSSLPVVHRRLDGQVLRGRTLRPVDTAS